MNLTFSDEDRVFQRGVRDWFAANTPEVLRRKVESGQMLTRDEIVDWQRRLDEQGFLVVGWPKEHGGPGWTPTQRYLYDLERAAANAPVGLSMGVIMLGPVLMAFGSDAQKARYLPRIRRCEDWWCQGYSEPGAGSDLASLATTAVSDGDDYVINGSKIWTTYAHWATHMFCLVRTANTGKKQEGISFLLIEMDRPGIEVRPIVSIDGEHHLNQVFFADLRVPRSNLVGLSELALDIGAEQAWPWHPEGALAEAAHVHSMERYAFLRACTIYGGSDEVQKTVLAKSMLAGAAR